MCSTGDRDVPWKVFFSELLSSFPPVILANRPSFLTQANNYTSKIELSQGTTKHFPPAIFLLYVILKMPLIKPSPFRDPQKLIFSFCSLSSFTVSPVRMEL